MGFVVAVTMFEREERGWVLILGKVSATLVLNNVTCDVYSTAHTNAVNAVSFHPSGNYLVSASSDTTLKVIPHICIYLHTTLLVNNNNDIIMIY